MEMKVRDRIIDRMEQNLHAYRAECQREIKQHPMADVDLMEEVYRFDQWRSFNLQRRDAEMKAGKR
jgi:hypothetical protein